MTDTPVMFRGLPIIGRMPPFKPALRDLNRKGKKTMTRRVINPQPPCNCAYVMNGAGDHALCYAATAGEGITGSTIWVPPTPKSVDHRLPCSYGKAGDIRCMTEPMIKKAGHAFYADDGAAVVSLLTGQHLKWRWKKEYLTSIHFPTEAARFVVRYTEIVAERVQDISEADAQAEGAEKAYFDFGKLFYCFPRTQEERYVSLPGATIPSRIVTNDPEGTFRCGFNYLWDSINLKRGYGWDANPWVWGLRYKEVA